MQDRYKRVLASSAVQPLINQGSTSPIGDEPLSCCSPLRPLARADEWTGSGDFYVRFPNEEASSSDGDSDIDVPMSLWLDRWSSKTRNDQTGVYRIVFKLQGKHSGVFEWCKWNTVHCCIAGQHFNLYRKVFTPKGCGKINFPGISGRPSTAVAHLLHISELSGFEKRPTTSIGSRQPELPKETNTN